MTIRTFNPAQLQLQELEVDDPAVLKRDYVRLKGIYTMPGLTAFIDTLVAHIREAFRPEAWDLLYHSTNRANTGEVLYLVMGNDRDPLIVAKPSENGREWEAYIVRYWGERVLGFVDATSL